jgi:predicted RNA binding protein YcfA (HicA-like mRNA interferase family)
MTRIYPVAWKKFVKTLKFLGYVGPFQKGKHPFMLNNNFCLTIPNPHTDPIGRELLVRILQQANISKESWNGALLKNEQSKTPY